MEGVVALFLAPAIIFLIFVAPIWILMHYRSKRRSRHELSERESALLEELIAQADRMADRIETLEAILDQETPGWRRRTQGEAFSETSAASPRSYRRGERLERGAGS
jgi:phage shock protein B